MIPLLALLLLPACPQRPEEESADRAQASFDAARAFEDLQYLVEEIGPRRIGTKQSEATRAYIRKQLESQGWSFEEESFTAVPPEGARRKGEITGVNLLARRAGTEPGEVWIASHYDTFDLPGFVGANDGGSSTAVLIELGRQLGGPGPREGKTVVLCWFDGEEPFGPLAWDDRTNSTFGSRHQVEKLKEEDRLDQVHALVLLDMVGDKQLGLMIETSSTAWLADLFRRAAPSVDPRWVWARNQVIKDDHMHFARSGVPAIDLIDFNYGPRNEYWHDQQDTLDKCSAESLGQTGRLVLHALPAIELHDRTP